MSPILTIFIPFLLLIYFLVRKRFNYWKKRNVPFVEPVFPFGNYKDFILFKRHASVIAQDICKKYPDAPYVGTYYGTDPALLVKDPELLRIITTKDFYYFSSREISDYNDKEVITQGIFFNQGDKWKVLRQNFTSLFSSLKLKNMFYVVKKCSVDLEVLVDKEIQRCPNVEVKDLMVRYTIDSISSCAFGIDSNVMGGPNDGKNPFKNISGDLLEVSTIMAVKGIFRALWPRIFYGIGLKAFYLHVNDFFFNLLTEVFKSRQYKPTPRNDFVDLVLDLRICNNNILKCDKLINTKMMDNEQICFKFNDELMVSQCIAFFAGGFETSALTLSFTFYELAKNKEAQNRAIVEVDEYLKRHGDDIEYDCVHDLPYLLACIDEALRLHPILGIITREVVDGYTLPTGLYLEKGSRIHIPVRYLHYHPNYFPEPDKYRPERFLGKERKNIKTHTYMPFGEGQRICIGKRFAKMQIMTALITVLKNYKVELAANMPRSVQLDPRSFLSHTVDGIHLKFVHRKQNL